MRATSNDNFTARRVKVEARNDRGKAQRANSIGEEKRGEERRGEERGAEDTRKVESPRTRRSFIRRDLRLLVPSRYDARNFIARRTRLPLPLSLSLSLLSEYVVIETRRASIEFTEETEGSAGLSTRRRFEDNGSWTTVVRYSGG